VCTAEREASNKQPAVTTSQRIDKCAPHGTALYGVFDSQHGCEVMWLYNEL